MTRGERDQVAAGRAAEFEHAGLRRRRVQPEQEGERRQMFRRALGKRMESYGTVS